MTTNFPTRYIVCADLDNDGLPDLVATQAPQGGTTERNRLYYMRNTSSRGTISFAAPESFTIPNGTRLVDNGDLLEDGSTCMMPAGCEEPVVREIGQVVIKDLEGDGKADLVIANSTDNHVFAYRNTTIGTDIGFALSVDLEATDTEAEVNGLDVKDLNKDELPEIVIGKISSAIFVLQNTSTPAAISFGRARMIADNAGFGSIRNLAVGDINNDGKSDILCNIYDPGLAGIMNNVQWVLNETADEPGASISFSAFVRPALTTSFPKGNFGLDLGDIDGDGKLDALLSSPDGEGPHILHNTTSDGAVSFAVADLAQKRSRNVRLADMNLDGKPDLLLANSKGPEGDPDLKIFVISNTHCMKPIITPDMGTVCDGAPFFVEATHGAGVNYTWTSNPASTPGTGQAIDLGVLLSTQGDYTVTARASIGTAEPSRSCGVDSDPTMQIRRLGGDVGTPTLSLTAGGTGTTACAGENVTISSSSIATFWCYD